MQLPKTIEEIIIELDKAMEPIDIGAVQSTLMQARSQLKDKVTFGEAWGELVAFTLQSEQEDHFKWRTHFGPMMRRIDEAGNEFYSPDVREIGSEIVKHWEQRADTLGHPVLKARYADLVWDLTRHVTEERPDIRFAHLAIDNYAESVKKSLNSEKYQDITALKRGLQLATSIRDNGRTEHLKKMIIERFYNEVKVDGWWRPLYEVLTTNRKCNLSNDEKKSLIGELEKLLSSFTADETLNPFHAEDTANYLLSYYTANKDHDGSQRVAMIASVAFEKISAKASPLQAMSWLHTAMEFAHRAGNDEYLTTLRIKREEAIRNSASEMRTFRIRQTITSEQIDQVVDQIIDSVNWQQSLFNIATNFITPKCSLWHQVQETNKLAPITAMMTSSILAEDFVAAQVGGENDKDGALFRHLSLSRQSDSLFLSHALRAAIEKHQLSAEEIAAFMQGTELFSDFTLIVSGVKAWLNDDFIKCLFVLVPQVENAFRNLARQLGEAVTKDKRGQKGWEIAVNLGDLLSQQTIQTEIGEDIHFLIKSIYADARGLNLRNTVAHGLIGSDDANIFICDLIIHSMLVLGAYKDVATACVKKSEFLKKQNTQAAAELKAKPASQIEMTSENDHTPSPNRRTRRAFRPPNDL